MSERGRETRFICLISQCTWAMSADNWTQRVKRWTVGIVDYFYWDIHVGSR